MAEAKATKNKAKKRQKQLSELEESAERASEEVDSKLRDDEKYVLVTIFFFYSLKCYLILQDYKYSIKKKIAKPVSFICHSPYIKFVITLIKF